MVVIREARLGEGCSICLEVCPSKAPQFGAEPNAKVQMCNLCIDGWPEGKNPICVAGCRTRALGAL